MSRGTQDNDIPAAQPMSGGLRISLGPTVIHMRAQTCSALWGWCDIKTSPQMAAVAKIAIAAMAMGTFRGPLALSVPAWSSIVLHTNKQDWGRCC